jgi:hypothetical protein
MEAISVLPAVVLAVSLLKILRILLVVVVAVEDLAAHLQTEALVEPVVFTAAAAVAVDHVPRHLPAAQVEPVRTASVG